VAKSQKKTPGQGAETDGAGQSTGQTTGATADSQMAAQYGNAFMVQRMLDSQASGEVGAATEEGAEEEEELSWRELGNLQGQPPVRSEEPPNKGIEEHESVYNQRRAGVEADLQGQRAMADRFLGESQSPMDHRYWFSRVYSYVTDGELVEAKARAFHYPSYALQCTRYFAKIYEDNVKAADMGGEVEEHWARAFEVCADDESLDWADLGDAFTAGLYRAVASLVASMQAHIRFDLPRAEAWVFQSHYSHMEGAKIQDFEPDFMSMMDIFDRASGKMNAEIADLNHLPADVMPRSMQDLAMNRWFDADMATERAQTWERTEALVGEGRVGPDPYREDLEDGTEGGALKGDVTAAGSDHLANLEGLSDPELRPTMEQGFLGSLTTLLGLDGGDADVRDAVGSKTNAELAAISSPRRAQMMRRCASGMSFNEDEDAILQLVRASILAGDLPVTIDAANAYDLLAASDFSQYTTLRTLFRVHYYPSVGLPVAMAYIRHCMVGKTNEWHEAMIMDILEAKRWVNSDGEVVAGLPLVKSEASQLIEQIGLEFEGGGFDGGIIELEEQLDGADEDRLHMIFGTASGGEAGDARVRRQVATSPVLACRHVAVRVAMVKRLMEGVTRDDDEAAIHKVLIASVRRGDLVQLVDTVGAHKIAAEIHGDEWRRVQDVFRRSYYPQTGQAAAFRLISTCIVGATSEWEQEMIADLICLRSDGRDLIKRVGGAFEGGGFKEGLNKLEWQLDGEDQARITRKFGSSGTWW
jgi:hypothetical protein